MPAYLGSHNSVYVKLDDNAAEGRNTTTQSYKGACRLLAPGRPSDKWMLAARVYPITTLLLL